jgi:hypothetical protein
MILAAKVFIGGKPRRTFTPLLLDGGSFKEDYREAVAVLSVERDYCLLSPYFQIFH